MNKNNKIDKIDKKEPIKNKNIKNIKTLRELREEKGLTRSQLANDCFLHPMSIYNYETGKSEPSISIALILSQYFNVSVYDIKW